MRRTSPGTSRWEPTLESPMLDCEGWCGWSPSFWKRYLRSRSSKGRNKSNGSVISVLPIQIHARIIFLLSTSFARDILSSIFPSCPSFKFATISLLWYLHMPALHSRSCILLVCLCGVDADQVRKVMSAFAHACWDGRPSAGCPWVWIAEILPISVTKSSTHAAGWMVPYPWCLVLYAGVKISHRNA